jgi:sialate O-acetylesterase
MSRNATISKCLFVTAAAVSLLLAPACLTFAQGPFQPPPPPKPFPFVSPLFGDDMVLQRDKADTIWGWSEQPGDKVTVQIGDTIATGVAQTDRRWEVKIKPPAAGGPYTVKITGRETIELHTVMVGDVWLCTGQSNMLVSLREAKNGDDEVKTANFPDIRFFSVNGHAAYNHTGWIGGTWKLVTPETAARVSAVGYYFAREVQKEMHVPIGLIVNAIGGTPAEAWTSAAALRPLKDFDVPLDMVDRLAASGAHEYGDYIHHWYDEYDIGLKGNWSAPEFDDSTWKPVTLPGGFAELGVPQTPALAWFRKEIDLSDPLPAGTAMMFLGIIERMDTVYVNGKEAGGSAWVENPRRYFMRDGMLKPGRNVITIRVLKIKPDGGFMSKPEDLHLVLGDKSNVPLAGAWRGQISVDARPPQPLPIGYQNWPVMPSVLYEGVLKPVAPLSITGALWYQGEENSPRGYEYRKVLPAMIADWRNLFGQGNFPFYIVSLPEFKPRSATPVDGDEWAETRESQAITAATVPNSCLAVTIDTGDPDNIHTKDKLPVGQRLAYCALAKYYGKHVVYEGPTLTSFERLPASIRLHFAHTDGGLVAKGDKLQEFTIAGEDHKWYWADARIDGDTIVVSSPSVPNPKEVRYAWQSNPAANLFNGAGLPAAPFRTDTWPGITQDVRPY